MKKPSLVFQSVGSLRKQKVIKKLFVIGNPIRHSKSPTIHNYWLKKYNIKATYTKVEANRDELLSYVNNVKNKEIKGFNVTLPFKKDFLNLVDYVENEAKNSLAVNTIFENNGKVIGTNTDGLGFVTSLRRDLNFELKRGLNIFCYGAGGAAYGIISELIKCQPSLIEISNRTLSKAEILVSHFSKKENNNVIFKTLPWGEEPQEYTDIVINTSTCGMNINDNFPSNLKKLSINTLVYDIIYNPKETVLMKIARQNDLRAVNGIYMLVRQAAESFRKWFGINLSDKDISDVIKLLGHDV